MKLFLGIDGGGTYTSACLADAAGRVLARAEAGLGNPSHATDAVLRTHFEDLQGKLLRDGRHRPGDVVSVFAGMAGVTCEATAARVRRVLQDGGLQGAQIGIDHDIRIALAGGLAGRPGIALIVGTGSSCYGRDENGRTWQSGGWGSLVADEGSGYWLGVRAMTAAVRMADGRQPETQLWSAVFTWLGISHVSEILNRIHEKELTRPQIAAFAKTLLRLGEQEDVAALEILASGAEELAQLVAANHRQLQTSAEPEVVITGGLGTADSVYRPLIEAAIVRLVPAAKIVKQEMAPAEGGALLAIQQYEPSANMAEIAANLKGSK